VRSAARASDEGGSTPVARCKQPANADSPGSSSSKQGRRARRKEKMASADARARLLASP